MSAQTPEDPERVRRWKRCEITLGELRSITRDEIQGVAEMTQSWLENGRTDDTRAALEGLICLEPRAPQLWTLLAAVHLSKEDYASAEQFSSYAIALDDNLAAYAVRGEAAARDGRRQDAIEDLQVVLRRDPQGTIAVTPRARLILESLQPAPGKPKAPGKRPAKPR